MKTKRQKRGVKCSSLFAFGGSYFLLPFSKHFAESAFFAQKNFAESAIFGEKDFAEKRKYCIFAHDFNML
ncbi:MAG: hypothetical protein J5605_02870 [Bacteroidales bacterium]|nr:hypothetical protein [Bacteroidales bacterium]